MHLRTNSMEQPDDHEAPPVMSERDIYFIETFLRQRGDYTALLAIDALVLRDDLNVEQKAAVLQKTIQGAMNG